MPRHHVDDPAFFLQRARDPQQPALQKITAVTLEDRRPDNDVGDSGLVFQRREDHTACRAGPLANDDKPRHRDPRSILHVGEFFIRHDPVGGDLFEPCVRSMAWGGRALVIGFASGNIPKLPTNLTLLKGCSIVGVFWGNFRLKETLSDNENFQTLFK